MSLNTSIETRALSATLGKCDSEFRKALSGNFKVDDADSVCHAIVALFDDSDDPIDELIERMNDAIEVAVERAVLEPELNCLGDFIAAVAVAGVKDKVDWSRGNELRIQGENRAWALRLAIDAASRRLLMSSIEATTASELLADSTLSIEAPTTRCDPGDVLGRLYEIVSTLVSETFLSSNKQVAGECPSPVVEGGDAFRAYCEKVNRRLQNTNGSKNHIFSYVLLDEPKAVVSQLLSFMPHLRFFVCVDLEQKSQILHVDNVGNFEGWIANALFQIQEKRFSFEQEKSLKNKGKENMSSNNGNINIKVSGGAAQIHTGTGDAVIKQQNNTNSDADKLLAVLQEMLDKSDVDKGEHRQLRADVRDILEALKEKKEPPKNSKNWLETSAKALKQGDALLASVKTAIGLIGTVGGMMP